MDSGCSKIVSPCASDFVPISLVDLLVPFAVNGIAGQLIAHQKGCLQYKTRNDVGGVTVLKCDGYVRVVTLVTTSYYIIGRLGSGTYY
jgi:hypothetical protein